MKNPLNKDYKHLSLEENFDEFSHKKIKKILRWALEKPAARLSFIEKICALAGVNALSQKSLTKVLKKLLRAKLLTFEMVKILCESRNGIEVDILDELTEKYEPLDMEFVKYITDFVRNYDFKDEDEDEDEDSLIQIAISNLLGRAAAYGDQEMTEFLCGFEAPGFSLEKAIETAKLNEAHPWFSDEINDILQRHLNKHDAGNDILEVNEPAPQPPLNPYHEIIERLKHYKTKADADADKAKEAEYRKQGAGNWLTKTFYTSKKAYYESRSESRGRNKTVAEILLRHLEYSSPENLKRNQFFRKKICKDVPHLNGHTVRSDQLNSIFKDAKKIHKARNPEPGVLERLFSCFR